MIKSQLTLHDQLKSIFGFSSFKGRQEEIIKNLQVGNDSLVIMPTGGGKSMCYQLPALIDNGVAIIVSPLIALMKNQVDSLRGFNENDFREVAEMISDMLDSLLLNEEDKKKVFEATREKILDMCKSYPIYEEAF